MGVVTGTLQNLNKELKKCLIDSFKKTDESFLAEAARNRPSWKDGSTAVVLLVVDDVVYSANLGDSKAFLCRKEEHGIKCIPLSKDHTPASVRQFQHSILMLPPNQNPPVNGSLRRGRGSRVLVAW